MFLNNDLGPWCPSRYHWRYPFSRKDGSHEWRSLPKIPRRQLGVALGSKGTACEVRVMKTDSGEVEGFPQAAKLPGPGQGSNQTRVLAKIARWGGGLPAGDVRHIRPIEVAA